MKRTKRNCLKCGKQIEKAKRGAPPPSQIVCAECQTKIRSERQMDVMAQVEHHVAAEADYADAKLKDRIEELEAALRSALYYVKRVGDDGEGGTSDHAVTLDAIQQALKGRTEFIQTAADTKTTLWPTNLDPTAWGEK